MKVLLILACGVVASIANDNDILQYYRERNIEFTSDIYKEFVKNENGNFVMCPLSAEIALGLTLYGALGETGKQLAAGLHFPNDPDKLLELFAHLTPHLKSSDKYKFDLANKIYVQEKFEPDENYKTNAVKVFGSDIENIDFEQNVDAANTINSWVEEHTDHKIKELLQSDWLSNKTRLVLLNALYFKGTWQTEFKKDNTRPDKFFLDNSHYVDVEMMEQKSKLKYYANKVEKYQMLELPYNGDDITMTIVLPDNPEHLNTLEENIPKLLKEPAYKKSDVELRLPKFEMDTTIQFKEILQKLNVVLPFENGANFRGMISPSELDELKIDRIVQKSHIEVDEKGTVATAATAVIMNVWRSAKIINDVQFHADHPFIFYLKHKVSGIMFIGRYNKPTGEVKPGTYKAPFRYSRFTLE